MEVDVDLKAVQHELETLVWARSAGDLRPVDKVRYAELCDMERVLLGKARAGESSA
jgi:hypothetical protein